ncbi:MAG: hypothetical protein WAM97_18380, partial [Acidimicrobiales bacterium]
AMLDALVRASGIGDRILEQLKNDEAASRVLTAVDGSRSQREIVQHLTASGMSISEATVSRKLGSLAKDYGLVALSHRNNAGNVYHRTRLDRALHISRRLSK